VGKRLVAAVLAAGVLTLGIVGLTRFLAGGGGTGGDGARVAAAATVAWARHVTVKAMNLPEQLPVASGFKVEDVFAVNGNGGMGFDQPVGTVYPSGEKDRIFVVSKTGVIFVISDLEGKNGGPKRSVFMDINPYLRSKNLELGQEKEWGILGMAFHPKYQENGQFFITYNFLDNENGRVLAFDRLARFSVSKADPNKADMTSEVPLITQMDNTPNHNGGCIEFGDDGYLYYGMGDDGYPRDQQDNARWVDRNFFAAIYRLDVDRRPENLEPNAHRQPSTQFPSAVDKDVQGPAHYKVPVDNPFIGISSYMGQTVDPQKVRTEIYAHGFRNPWRFSIDHTTGRLFVADVGEDRYEEINLVTKGGDYGWPYKEATNPGPRSAAAPADGKFMDPIFFYEHGAGNIAVTGGFVYRGTRLPELNGCYIFADYGPGQHIWALKEVDGKWDQTLLLSSSVPTPVAIGPDPRNGDILVSCIGPGAGMPVPPAPNSNGRVVRIVRTGVQGPPPPEKLSLVGAFKDLKTLEPVEGLNFYEPNVTFWSDYAVKSRWFMVPNGSNRIGFDAKGNWKFPAGMVWVKHFDMELTRGEASTRRRLETRFLVKTKDNVYGITYKWRADYSDADLVPEAGEDEVLTINDHGTVMKQTWHYPSQSECMTCHTQVGGGALAFNTWQLNGQGKGTQNQIEMLAHAGYFSADSQVPELKTLGAYAKADDAHASLEWRVRSYLGVNCVYCHQPGGAAQGQWDARPWVALDTAGIINGMLTNNRGDAGARVIVPGDVTHSMVVKRLEAKDAPRMPPLASNELDVKGQGLIREYIESLK
jgi:glucose/arabinose dehydrogenase